MTYSFKPGMETFARVLLTFIVLMNAVVPTTALAMPPGSNEPAAQQAEAAGNSLPAMEPVHYQPSMSISNPTRFSAQADEPKPVTPGKDPVEFSISTSKGEVDNSRTITINIWVRNSSESELTNLTYNDKLEKGLEFGSSPNKQVKYNFITGAVTYKVGLLKAGEEAVFSYILKVKNNKAGRLSIHNAEIEYDLKGETRAQTAELGFADGSSLVNPDSLIIVPDQAGDGWESAGRYSIYLGDKVLSQDAVVSITPANLPKGPKLQFNLDLIQTSAPATMAGGQLGEQDINLTKKVETDFASPAYLEINLDGVADLANIPADQEPYVATYDEENNIWVKVPIVDQNIATNSVTVPAAHFSTWGAGLGNSLPKNGANVLLFDQPYTSLFTGASRYSVPIWTPPGRAGVSPDISLSYSSATVDGVLGDVQAPWVGVGWNIDGIEIVRKIITNENGYGYVNSFALTLNGTVYELLVDPNNPNRYYTKQGSFLYVERHNFALGNAGAVTNKTGEWWEVVTTDGTRYRLGRNTDSEQLALMYGYECKTGNPCTTPGGAYATLGYAGKADDLVALRWRVDRITDTHGNTISYTYTETQPSGATMLAPFDRESYLHTIAYTGFEGPAGTLSPGYEVEFVTAPRSGIGDVPTTFNIWDNLDSKYLDRILIKCLLCGGSSQLIRTYDFNYSLAPVPNANGTLTLSDIQISGEGFSESGQAVPAITAPTIKFTYQNLDNRNVTGTSNDRYTYPRLQVINNGTGGLLTYSYETDGRGIDSWYDYRVKDVNVNGGLGTAAAQSYTYTTPVYTGSGGNANLGDLIGYTSTSEKQLDYNNGNAVILETKHDFGTQGLDTGYELKTESLSGTTVLRRTTNTYVTDNSKAPFSGWNYRYLFQTVNYVNSGGAIVPASKVVYSRDPSTGNLLLQTDYLGLAAYRKTYYEYLTNPDPAKYILDKASRVLVVNASNSTLTDTRYHYDDKLNSAPVWGDLTLTQSLTGSGNSTVDTGADYDVYGNVIRQIQYTSYGTMNVKPTGGTQESSMVYDSTFQSYPVTQTNPMGQDTSTSYLYRLGVPYQTTDVNGWITTTTYDSLGRQLSIRVPGVQDESVWYTYPVPNGNGSIPAPYSVEMQILDTTAGIYRSVWGIYDGMGRQIQMQVFDDDVDKILVTDSEFNAQGAVSRQSSPYYVNAGGGYYTSPLWGQYTSSQYDALGRVTQVTQPGNIVSTTSYDGFTTTSIDPKGNKTERATDGLGRLTLVREYSDSSTVYATTRYANDELNRLVQVTDAQSNVTELTYDWLGRKTGMDDPDMGIWTYQYNPTGTLQQQTDARTQTLSFTYDALNRLLTKTGSGVNTSNTYGNTLGLYGFRTGMTDGSGTTSWTYSNFGRTVTEQRAFTGTTAPRSMTTESDWLGRPLQVTYPDGEVLSYTYDALGRPDKLNSSAGPAASLVDLTYNVLGQVTKQTLGNGLEVTNSYDSANNRLVSRVSTGNLINFGYTYDPAGNITGITDAALNETHQYTYDFLSRLKTASAFTTGNTSAIKYDQQFEYDKVGNITEMNNWVTPTPIGALNSKASLELIAPVSYRSPQLNNAAGSGGFLAMPVRQVQDTDTPTDTLTPTDTFTPTFTASSTQTFTPTNTKVPTNTPAGSPTPTATPTATLTPLPSFDAYTMSMLHLNGSDSSTSIMDQIGKVWTANGNAQIDTAQSKFDGASALFDGSGDYISSPDSIDWQLDNGTNTDQWTVDFWVRFSVDPGTGTVGLIQQFGDANNTWSVRLQSNNLRFTVRSAGVNIVQVDQPWDPDSATWYHVAIVKNGTAGYMHFVNGIQLGSTTTDTDPMPNFSGGLRLGLVTTSSDNYLNGWLDEIRLSKGVARWTVNFTPPAAPYGNGLEPTYTPAYTATTTATNTNTGTPTKTFTPSLTPTPFTFTPTSTPQFGSLLAYWSFEGSAGTTVYDDAVGDVTANNATLTNGPVIQSSGAQGSSAFFDGVNDYASITDQAEVNKNGSFTISAWINPASLVTSRTQYIVQKGAGNKDYGLITVSTQGTATPTANPGNSNANGSIAFQVGDLTPNTLYGPVLPVNTWTMVTGVYDSAAGQMRLYLNGQLVASQSVTGTVSMSASGLTFSSSAAANVYHGSLDEVRFYNRSLTDAEVQAVFGVFPTPIPMSVTATATVVTATPNITPLPQGQQPWGTGNDGSLTVASGNTFNVNTGTNGNNGRTCADGVAYNVTQLGDTAATVDTAINPTATATPTSTVTPVTPPNTTCLAVGDEVLLIQLAGDSATGYNAGSYEFLRIASVNGTAINFTTQKTKWYGSSWRSDQGVGVGSGQVRVMLIRVPNYSAVTVNGTLTANAYDGNKYGLMAFRVNGTLSGNGVISVNGLGFRGNEGYGAGGSVQGTNWPPGGGGGYGTNGTTAIGAGGQSYGLPNLSTLFYGSGGGENTGHMAGGNWVPGSSGEKGGGILWIAGQTINFTGTLSAKGNSTNGSGAGSGGSIRLEGANITLPGSITTAGGYAPSTWEGVPGGSGGYGRIAVYYQTALSVSNSNPAAYTGVLGQAPTATPSSTPISFATPSIAGNGKDGILTVGSGVTFNINSNTSNGRTCADGITYSVAELSSSWARLTTNPTSNCLSVNDEVMLIHLYGSGPNKGNYELVHVGGIVGSTVYFLSSKVNYYGVNANDDSGVGSTQSVSLIRVPNYSDVTVNGTLTANAYDGNKYGLMAFRVNGTLSGNGVISVNGLGFRGNEGYGAGGSVQGTKWPPGGGGGYGTNGTTAIGAGGQSYGLPNLSTLFYGSGGGENTGHMAGGNWVPGSPGEKGGGILWIAGQTINFTGTISAKGNSTNGSGAGSGGSIRIEGANITLSGSITTLGGYSPSTWEGVPGGSGGYGRIAIYYYNSLTSNLTANTYTYLQQVNPNGTSTPTYTPAPTSIYTSTPTPTAFPTGWVKRTYAYSETIPHAVISLVDDAQSTLAEYAYDANGNMTCRTEDGVIYKQVYNTENRISSIQKLAEGTCDEVTRLAMQWDFAYDGDGLRTATLITPYDESGDPQSAVLTSYYFGGAYEVTGTAVKKYYSFGGQTVMRDANGLQYFLTDHLGSVVAITDTSGTLVSQQRYLPFGGVRSNVTTPNDPSSDFGYTGQRLLDSGIGGLMDYKARFYSPYITHFSQPDSIVPDPQNPQAYNHYSYGLNNPIRYNDPTGHSVDCGLGESGCKNKPIYMPPGRGSRGDNSSRGGDDNDNSDLEDDLGQHSNHQNLDLNFVLSNPFDNGDFELHCPTTQPNCHFTPRPAVNIYFNILRINPEKLAWASLGLLLSILGIESARNALALSRQGIGYLAGYHTIASAYYSVDEAGHVDTIGLALTTVGVWQPAAVYTSSASVLGALSDAIYEVPVRLPAPSPGGPYCQATTYCQ
ncbi:MAG: DUF11 domain-containing protein [Chloroflexi bacterium]|nr:DUF11 domain-containing protein [Chloroflexota bacterium]